MCVMHDRLVFNSINLQASIENLNFLLQESYDCRKSTDSQVVEECWRTKTEQSKIEEVCDQETLDQSRKYNNCASADGSFGQLEEKKCVFDIPCVLNEYLSRE